MVEGLAAAALLAFTTTVGGGDFLGGGGDSAQHMNQVTGRKAGMKQVIPQIKVNSKACSCRMCIMQHAGTCNHQYPPYSRQGCQEMHLTVGPQTQQAVLNAA